MQVYTRNDDGTVSWEEAESGGGLTRPSFYRFGFVAETLGDGSQHQATLTEDSDYPNPEGMFTLNGGNELICETAGVYSVGYFAQPSVIGVVTTPGAVELEFTAGVNGQDKDPAADFYPRVVIPFAASGTLRGSLMNLSFPQPLDVGDTVAMFAQTYITGGGSIVAGSVSLSFARLTLLRLSDL